MCVSNIVKIISASTLVFSLFFFNRIVQADELADLKNRLKAVERERQWLIEQIESLESDNKANGEKIKQQDSVNPPEEKPFKSSVSLSYYWDSREYNTFGITTSTTGLPFDFTLWGFTDLHGNQHMTDDYFDFNRFFMEYRLSRVIEPQYFFGLEGLGTQIEYNDSNGSGNQLVRFGLTYKKSFPWFTKKDAWVQFRGFPYESDGSGQQLSWAYYFPLTDRIWISGFADLNLIEGADDQWVIEPQLNIKLTERANFLVEYRYNGFEDDNATLDGEGVAIGMSYKF